MHATIETDQSGGGGLIPRATVEQIVGHRNQAIKLYAEAFEAIAAADAKLKAAFAEAEKAAPGQTHFYDGREREVEAFHRAVQMPPNREQYLRTATRLVDINVWSYIIGYTALERLMDKEAKDKLRQQMRYVGEEVDRRGKLVTGKEADLGMPPVTVDNIRATLEQFAGDAKMIFQRGVANAFSQLDRRFRSHDGFKIGGRVILTYCFDQWGSFSYSSGTRDTLIDLERAFAVLDGDGIGSYSSTIYAMEEQRRGLHGPRQSYVETQFFRIRGFKNDNAHLWFTRDDLVEKVNKLLAEYYGEVIGDGQTQEEDPLFAAKTTPAKYYGFYPTPEELAKRVAGTGNLWHKKGQPRRRVLEPSAGSGNLARACFYDGKEDHHDDYVRDPLVDCVEIQPHLADGLRTDKRYRKVYCEDFLKLSPKATGLYDSVVMNPPFDRERDVDHVVHALDFLEPDGCLVAVMSAGTEFRETKKSQAFRALIERMGGAFNDLPAGSFSSVGTNINTLLLRVNKSGGRVDRWWRY